MKSYLILMLLYLLFSHQMLSQEVKPNEYPLTLGLDIGLAINDADIDGILIEGRVVSTSLIKPLGKHLSAIASYEWTRTRGLENFTLFNFIQPDSYWIPVYESQGHSLDLMLSYDLKIPNTRFTCGVGLGGGLSTSKASFNFLDSDGISYYESTGETRYFVDELPSFRHGVPSYDYIILGYDDTYETEGIQKKGIFRVGDNNFTFTVPFKLYLMGKITKRLKVGLSYLIRMSDNDYLDGIKYRYRLIGEIEPTNNADIQHSFRISMIYHLRSSN